MKKDRFVAGGIAGFIASVICDIIVIIYKSFGTILNLPLFRNMPLNAAYATLSTALIYGLVISLTLKIIERKMHLL